MSVKFKVETTWGHALHTYTIKSKPLAKMPRVGTFQENLCCQKDSCRKAVDQADEAESMLSKRERHAETEAGSK